MRVCEKYAETSFVKSVSKTLCAEGIIRRNNGHGLVKTTMRDELPFDAVEINDYKLDLA